MGRSSSFPIGFSFETLCAQAGLGTGEDGSALVTPIAQTTTFCRVGVSSTAEHQYSRVSNPTVAALEAALGRLEGVGPGVCFGTGLAAEAALFLAVLEAGDHVICSKAVYGGTTRLLEQVLSGLGVRTSFVDTTDVSAVRDALCQRTKLVFVETPSNPTLDVSDISAICETAHEVGALVAVDNTFLTPVLQQPLALGADISVISTTKYIDGHSVALGGALVSGDGELIERFRFIRKCTGAIQAPLNAWLTLQGLKTLSLRIKAQSATAERIADWLATQDEVVKVHYPRGGVAQRQHLGAHGAVVSFELAGGFEAGKRFVEAVELWRFVEHVGSVESLVTHPASMTHADVKPEVRRSVGLSDGLIRLSVGLEDVDELIADLAQAIAKAGGRSSVAVKTKAGSACVAIA